MSDEKPIIFCGEMVRAIREGRKTQTRRVVKPSAHMIRYCCDRWGCDATNDMAGIAAQINLHQGESVCPYGTVGTRLWVRENWRCATRNRFWGIEYVADGDFNGNFSNPRQDQIAGIATRHAGNVRPSIHMPRWASRLTLEVTDVRVQRVQEISEEDALAEGIDPLSDDPCAYSMFASLWDSINEKRGYGWQVNPWVWAVTFRVVKGGAA